MESRPDLLYAETASFWEVEIPVLGTSPSKQIIFGVLDCMEFHTVVTSNVI